MIATKLLYMPSRCKNNVALAFKMDHTTCVPKCPMVKIGDRSRLGPRITGIPLR